MDNRQRKSLNKTKVEVTVAGRIVAMRSFGKAGFGHIQDGSGRIQVYFQKNTLGDDQYALFKKLDIGDFIGMKGFLFRTKTNELTIDMEGFTLLSKSLRPLPEKWHGLTDVEIRYRQRYRGPDRQSRGQERFSAPHEDRPGDQGLSEHARVYRSRDADDAVSSRRRHGPAVQDAPQRPGHGPFPPHRARAVPQAAAGRRF